MSMSLLLFGGCASDDDASSLSLTPAGQNTIVFAADGTTTDNVKFTVLTNQSEWNVQSDKNWVTLTVNKNENSFTLRAKDSDVATTRTANITVSAGTATFVLVATQAVAVIPSLALDHDGPISFAADGTTADNVTFTVSTNMSSWQVISSQAWAIASKSGNSFTVSAVENKLYTASIPATITVTAGSATPVEIAVMQTGRDVALDGVEINGVTWAKYNVDAPGSFASSPEAFGKFFQFNRTAAWSATDPAQEIAVTGWSSSSGGSTWAVGNDPSPLLWRVPDVSDFNSLLDLANVSNEWTQQNGVSGRLFTDLSSNKTLFLPAVGFRYWDNGRLSQQGLTGHYGCSTASGNIDDLQFTQGGCAMGVSAGSEGISLRCVRK
ncbi:hypothetical protein FACS189464_0990 [Bacteroidia bacterium]|nr:hypothetical protein FACS189464_0990 [Bacteroidia bacterium]